jgi:adenylosuccinate synthase
MQINSVTGLCLTKLDVLDGLDEVKICSGYQDANGEMIEQFPVDAADYDGLTPVYDTVPGWSESTVGVQEYDALPPNAKSYIKCLEDAVGAPIDIISTGPDRKETIILRNPFE